MDEISFGPFNLNVTQRRLSKGDEPILLGSRALSILIALAERAGELVTHKELMSRAWPDLTVEESNLRVHVAALRKALGDSRDGARYISNISGRGYCLAIPVSRKGAKPVVPAAVSFQRLPLPLVRMVGRDDTVQALVQQLRLCRFVSIVGPGGVGKTTVAIAVAHALVDEFQNAVFFVDLSALTNAELVPTAVASALGFRVQTDDPIRSLLAFVSDRRILLVLDNCEHVIGVAAMLAERIVRAAPQAHVLATSRESLNVEGEYVHLLSSFNYPPEDSNLTAAKALEYPAAQLFMERVAASGHDGPLTDFDAPIVAKICQRLDGIALAIVLAASRVGMHGIRGTAELLDTRFSLLWRARRTAMPRHETLSAMIDWSYNLLSEQEKEILCRLSIFVGDFSLEAASHVASETGSDDAAVVDAIANLIAKSLVSRTLVDGSPSYRLLDSTRAYAAAKLAARGESDIIARSHAIFYSSYLERDEIVQSMFGEHGLSEYASHIGNVRAAIEWAFSKRGDTAVGIELFSWSAPLFIGLGLLDECGIWSERALSNLDEANRGTRQEMVLQEARALSNMLTKGNSDQVHAAFDRSLELAEAFSDRARQLRLLVGLNLFFGRLGDVRSALAVAERGGMIAEAAKHPAGIVWAEWWGGIDHHLLGNQAAAQFHLERGMTLAAELGTFNVNFFGGLVQRVRALVVLVRALWLRGFSDQALRHVQKVIDEVASLEHPVSTCVCLVYAATCLLWNGDLIRASALIEQLIAYAQRHSLEPYRAAGLALKGELAIARDRPEDGVDLLRSALKTLGAQQYNVLTTDFIGALSKGLYRIRRFDEALFKIDEAIAAARTSGVEFYLPELLRIKSQILSAQGDRESAIELLNEAIAIAQTQSALSWELRSTIDLARMLAEDGQGERAKHLLAQVYDRFTEGFDSGDLELARALLRNL